MKKTPLLLIGLFVFGSAFSQNQKEVFEGETILVKPLKFGVSKPLREIAAANPIPEDYEKPVKVTSKDAHAKRQVPPAVNPNALPQGEDPVWQKEHGSREGRATIANWIGMGGSGYPPDPSGAAGPNHYFQAVNTSYRIYSKTGSAVTSVASLSSLWSGSTNDGDPIVMYDKQADRWFISQFQVSSNSLLIAISTTNDPTGSYYTYEFTPVSGSFPDYPKYSIWHDGYYMAANYWGSTKRFIVFERAKMLAGDPGAGMLVRTMTGVPSSSFFCMLPADADGTLPPAGTPCYFFSYEDDAWSSGTTDQIRVYQMSVDWSAVSATVSLAATLPTQPFNASFASNWEDITQPGVSQKLDAIGGVLNYRAQYRIWTGYNSVVLCHAVKVNTSTGQAGVRWYELRESGGTWSIYQQGTFAPDTDSRWLGSIAMDDNGNIGMAYAVSSSSTFPSIRYTGRLASDPLGQMSVHEQTAIAGTSSQTGTERYGDYSHTALDPDGVTFWHTGEYVSSGKKTRIFSFQINATTLGVDAPSEAAVCNAILDGELIRVTAKNLPGSETMQVDLFDVAGKLISESKITPVSEQFQTSIDASGLAKGTYLVRIGNAGFQRVIKVAVN